ncbi:hypothetical protein ACU639_36565 [Streptomyces cynarae]|uniref:hypothetical protein n=1 Tax=Streptomyces cynarae TaxID=2981134 RepID=UPI00406C53AF
MDTGVRGKLEPLRGKLTKLADRGWLHKDPTGSSPPAREQAMAGGNDISATTVRRWRDELIAHPAAKAARLDRALKKIAKRGGEVVLIDGTSSPPSAAPARRTVRTTPASIAATACTCYP